ncbi:MAG: 2-keto-3-deoxy-L-fuconate dehydrogenase [Limimaricola cinnabarinus]|jgi:2-keto-3-deoxy-L-fuconate dehydrogenase|uniref:SDR family oxidoreductase n=1 Tax=Limimaricola cinnabarinus TaxID=1125964 RepID=UPI0039E45190
MTLDGRIMLLAAAGQGIGAASASVPDPTQAEQELIARQPIGCLAMVEDLTPTIMHLLSDDSRFVTGQAAPVDGGLTI